jgi:putative oxidoreductase
MKKLLTEPRLVNHALMLLRITLGLAFIYHGYGKIMNPDKWAWLGAQLPLLGTETLAPFWGFLAAVSEFFGGIALVLGLCIRPASLAIFGTMAVACLFHAQKGEGFELPLIYALLSIVVCLAGPDEKALDRRFFT